MKKASRFGPWPQATRNGLPTLWLFTDARAPVDLSLLPRGAGVVIRHYAHPQRACFARALVQQGHARGLIMLVAGDMRLALACGADGVHLPEYMLRKRRRPHPHFIITAAAHGAHALHWARYCDGIFLSPIFATQSHPGAPALGVVHAARLICRVKPPVFALGGVTAEKARQLILSGFSGIAAVDGWISRAQASI